MAQQGGKLCQVLRSQHEGYWKRFIAFRDKYVIDRLEEVDRNCLKCGFTLHGANHAEAHK